MLTLTELLNRLFENLFVPEKDNLSPTPFFSIFESKTSFPSAYSKNTPTSFPLKVLSNMSPEFEPSSFKPVSQLETVQLYNFG